MGISKDRIDRIINEVKPVINRTDIDRILRYSIPVAYILRNLLLSEDQYSLAS